MKSEYTHSLRTIITTIVLIISAIYCHAQTTSVLDSVVRVNYLMGSNNTVYVSSINTSVYKQGVMVMNSYAAYDQTDSLKSSNRTVVELNNDGDITDSVIIQNNDTASYYLWFYDTDNIKVKREKYVYDKYFEALMLRESIIYDSAGNQTELKTAAMKADSTNYYFNYAYMYSYDNKGRQVADYRYLISEDSTMSLYLIRSKAYLPTDSLDYEYEVYNWTYGSDTSYTYYYYLTDTIIYDHYSNSWSGNNTVKLDKREIFIYNGDGNITAHITHGYYGSDNITSAYSTSYSYFTNGLLKASAKYTYNINTKQWVSDGDVTSYIYYSDGKLKEKERTYTTWLYDNNFNPYQAKQGEKYTYSYNTGGDILSYSYLTSNDWVNYTVNKSITKNYSAKGCLSYIHELSNDFYSYEYKEYIISDTNCNIIQRKRYTYPDGALSENDRYEFYGSGNIKSEYRSSSTMSDRTEYDYLGNKVCNIYKSATNDFCSATNYYYTYYTNIDTTVCESEGLNLLYTNICNTGVYTDTLKSLVETDSIIVYNLTVNENVTRLDTGVCGNKLLAFNGKMYSRGVYDSVINKNTIGCNDIFRLSVTKYPEFYVETDTAICSGTSIYGKNESGIYYIKNSTIHGCDSTIKLTLNVADEPTNELKAEYNLCYSDSLKVELQDNFDGYLWSTGHNSESIVIKGEQLGEGSSTVYVDVEKGNCVTRFTSQVNVHPDTPADQCYVKGDDILFYPNPATDVLNIETGSELTRVDICDSNENILITSNISNNAQIDVSPLSTGKYTIKFIATGNVIYEKELIKL